MRFEIRDGDSTRVKGHWRGKRPKRRNLRTTTSRRLDYILRSNVLHALFWEPERFARHVFVRGTSGRFTGTDMLIAPLS